MSYKATVSKRQKSILLFAAKALVASLLIGLLIRSGALDFGALGVVVRSPTLLAADLGTWLTCSVLLAVVRWRLLLSALGIRVPLGRTFALQLTALFFNVVIPGNVGGDVVKALYVARSEPADKRASILLVVFVERFVGLSGLVAMAALVTFARFDALWAVPSFRPMVVTVAGFTAAFLVGPALFVALVRRIGGRLEAAVGGSSFVARILGQLVASARLFSGKPLVLLGALVASMLLHGVGLVFFTVLTRQLTGQDVSYGQIATVYPTGLLSVVLPVAPAGLGVGHMAFDRLFSAVGLTGGATVFNVFLLGQITPCLVGAAPYLALRSQLPTSEEAPTEAPKEPATS